MPVSVCKQVPTGTAPSVRPAPTMEWLPKPSDFKDFTSGTMFVFLCACGVCFAFGFYLGGITCPDEEWYGPLGWVFSYSKALKVLCWDFSRTSQFLERASGIPIYSASAGMSLVLCRCAFKFSGMDSPINIPFTAPSPTAVSYSRRPSSPIHALVQ